MTFYVFPEHVHSVSVGGQEYLRDPVTGGREIGVNPEAVASLGLRIGEPRTPAEAAAAGHAPTGEGANNAAASAAGTTTPMAKPARHRT